MDQNFPKNADMNTSSGHYLPSTPKQSTSSFDLEATAAAAGAGGGASTTPGRGLGTFGRQATQFVNNVAQQVTNVSGNSSKSMKNTSRFIQEELHVVFPSIMRRYVDSPTTMMWASRAIVNVCKSQRMKTALLDESILGVVQGVLEKYRGQGPAELIEWATLAQDILVAQDEE